MTDDEFHTLRGKAIQAFAEMEHGLFDLFRYFAGNLSGYQVGVIFDELTTRSKIRVISELAQVFTDEVKGITKEAGDINNRRNEIVHRLMVPRGKVHELIDHKEICRIPDKMPPTLRAENLTKFIVDCEALAAKCHSLVEMAFARVPGAPE